MTDPNLKYNLTKKVFEDNLTKIQMDIELSKYKQTSKLLFRQSLKIISSNVSCKGRCVFRSNNSFNNATSLAHAQINERDVAEKKSQKL